MNVTNSNVTKTSSIFVKKTTYACPAEGAVVMHIEETFKKNHITLAFKFADHRNASSFLSIFKSF